jgi:FMN phosphatase YigB (HAD superfamily)
MKFVYFDVGGVLIKDLSDINDGWALLLGGFGLIGKQRQKFDDLFKILEKRLDLGDGIKDFVSIMKSDFEINLPNDYSISDDLVNRFFYKNNGIWQTINKINKKYKLGLLTNMYDGMLDLIRNNNLIPNVDWKVIVDSSIEKCRKPDRKIYEIAQEKSGFKGSEILFIDNKKENLEIPKELGWQTYWYDSSDYDKSNQELAKFLR